jgi:hypothetical protein
VYTFRKVCSEVRPTPTDTLKGGVAGRKFQTLDVANGV